MTWTALPTFVAGQPLTAAQMNTYVRDNLNATSAGVVTTAGDLTYATGANALARLAIGTANQTLRTNAGATAPEWANANQQLSATVLGSAAHSFDISGISGAYSTLLIKAYLRGDQTGANTVVAQLTLNNDTGLSYDDETLLVQAATATASEHGLGTAIAFIDCGTAPGNNAGGNLFSILTIEIINYANTAHNKAALAQHATKYGTATTNVILTETAGFWRSNSAVNRVTLTPSVGNWDIGSGFWIYGVP